MGNSPPTGGLRLGSGEHTYIANVRGSSATLMFKGREVEEDEDGEITESWVMLYRAGISECGFTLQKILEYNPMIHHSLHDNKLAIEIGDIVQGLTECFSVCVEKDQAGLLLHTFTAQINFCIVANVTTITTNANRDITETSFDMYGNGLRRGLLIREWKRRSKDKNPYTGTVAHYYVNVENGEDVGLSVAVKKIRVMENGQLDFAVDGPEQHPVGALAYMFNEVLRTKTWKPTLCPHCASRYIQDRQSDSETDIGNFPAAPSHGSKRNGGGLVSNDGRFRGNNNGNTFINKLFQGRRR